MAHCSLSDGIHVSGGQTLKDVFFTLTYQLWLSGLVEKNHVEQFYG